MDYFCQECAKKPGWEFDSKKAFRHACQRCFRSLPCNDYGHKKQKVVVAPAPAPKDIVHTQVNSQAEVKLPKAKGTPAPVPQPVYPVDPPAEAKPELRPEPKPEPKFEATPDAEAPCPVPAPLAPPDNRNETDKMLDSLQPNRPGVKLEKVAKK